MGNIGDNVDSEFIDSEIAQHFIRGQIGVIMRAIKYYALGAAAKEVGYKGDVDARKIERFVARNRLQGEFEAIHNKELSNLVKTNLLALDYIKALTSVNEFSTTKFPYYSFHKPLDTTH